MKFAILVVLIVIVLAFIFLLWKASKSWRWYNLVAASFTMILAIAFIFPTAMVLKSRSAWHEYKEKMETKVETVEREHRIVKYGDASDANSGEGYLDLALKLSKIGREAGRRWRDLQVQNANAQSVVLSAPARAQAIVPGIDPAAAASPPPVSLPSQDLVVYGFGEGAVNGKVLPVFYMGEFRVTASAGNQITLTPTGPLEQDQRQRIMQAKSWSLYEMLPLDGHEPFVAEGSLVDDDNILGRVDDALVNGLFANRLRPETLQSYLRDGSRALDDDPESTLWVKIKFLKNHKIDVDSQTKQGALDGGFFDASGRSVDTRLQRDEDANVVFREGDTIVVKEDATKSLGPDEPPLLNVSADDPDRIGDVEATYFLRPLNDYRYVIRKLGLRLSESKVRKTELEEERKVLEDAIAATVAMLTSNQSDKLKLEQDLAQFQKELKAIKGYQAALAQNLKQARKNLSDLYKSNIQLEQELKRLHGAG